MNRCLLCLQIPTELNSYIPINSRRWLKLKILSTVEKHFWPIANVQNVLGVCRLCWSKLHDFHVFYSTIEEAHCRDLTISFEEGKSENCALEMELFRIFKADFTSTEESSFTIADIKSEDSMNKHESSLCAAPAMMIDKVDSNPLSTEKRKRGRPRKKCSTNENLIKKPKGKRGRPRKYIVNQLTKEVTLQNNSSATCPKIVNQNRVLSKVELIYQPSYTLKQDSLQQAALVKAISPPKIKRKRGRPRKIPQNETPKSTIGVHELVIPGNEIIDKQSPAVQGESVIKDVSLSLNEAKKLVHKKHKFSSLLKNRKRIQQHKALMRNYIATSVRCMKFLKK